MSKLNEIIKLAELHLSREEVSSIEKAYFLAKDAHEGQKRISGEPYFTHVEEVAYILAEMQLDANTIITGLLHDILEDTNLTEKFIKENFGKEVVHMVDGVTKLNKVTFHSERIKQAENFRKLFLALSSDIRILLVKLADRLHNMRTIEFHSPGKRYKISRETLDIFAPLADMIGMNNIKDELESLAFVQVKPDEEKAIRFRLEELSSKNSQLLENTVNELRSLLRNTFFRTEILGRLKTPYSIWEKMRKRNFNLLQMTDVVAVRIIVDSVEDCYYALGIAHAKYPAVHGKLKDYISTPKMNNYQSIHTVVFGPCKQQIEIQIRTKRMQETAEFGVAAHWNYKKGIGNFENFANYKWLRNFLILAEQDSYKEVLKNTKIDFFDSEIFCFTPQGDVVNLPGGATVLDFAYAVHTSVGHSCISAKVNGNVVPIYRTLQSGDTVEVTISAFQSPAPSWESKVLTNKAKFSIRKSLKSKKYVEYINLGQTITKQAIAEVGQEFSEDLIKQFLVEPLRCSSIEDLYIKVGQCFITPKRIKQLIGQYNPGELRPKQASHLSYSEQVIQTITVVSKEYKSLLFNLVNAFCKYDIEIINVRTECAGESLVRVYIDINQIDTQQIPEITYALSDISGVIEVRDML